MGEEAVIAEVKELCIDIDVDLEFLKELENKDLDAFVEIITGQEYDRRWTERLSSHKLYKEHFPDHKKYIEVIIDELQRFGGNTFANVFRRKGITYRQIICDVCKKMKIRYSTTNVSTGEMERNLLYRVLIECLPDMTFADLQRLVEYFNLGLECNENNVDELIYQITRVFGELIEHDEFAYQMALYMVVDNDVAYQRGKKAISPMGLLSDRDIFNLSEAFKEDAKMVLRSQTRKQMGKLVDSVVKCIVSKISSNPKQIPQQKKTNKQNDVASSVMGVVDVGVMLMKNTAGKAGGGAGKLGGLIARSPLGYIMGAVAVALGVKWISDPAYRVTIHATFYIALLRLKNKLQDSSYSRYKRE